MRFICNWFELTKPIFHWNNSPLKKLETVGWEFGQRFFLAQTLGLGFRALQTLSWKIHKLPSESFGEESSNLAKLLAEDLVPRKLSVGKFTNPPSESFGKESIHRLTWSFITQCTYSIYKTLDQESYIFLAKIIYRRQKNCEVCNVKCKVRKKLCLRYCKHCFFFIREEKRLYIYENGFFKLGRG